MLGQDRRVVAAGRRLEAIVETLVHRTGSVLIKVDVDPAALRDEQRTQIVDAVGVVGMLVGIEHGIEPIDLGVQKLLAQVGRGVDQDARDAAARRAARPARTCAGGGSSDC